MATFKTVVQKMRSDNTYPIYIRVTHNREIAYIKTEKYALSKKVKNGIISDTNIITDCASLINDYTDRLNKEKIGDWSVKDVVKFLKQGSSDILFKEYADGHIKAMSKSGRDYSAENYSIALKSFLNFVGDKITFQGITSKIIKAWIQSLEHTSRAKEMYPNAIKAMFNSGCDYYNDYDKGIIRINNQPFKSVSIPKSDLPEKRAISPYDIMKIFTYTPKTSRENLGKDVAMLIFYMVGINTIDLYKQDKGVVRSGKICYNRSKTEHARQDNAYIEIYITPQVRHIFDIYQDDKRLFSFYKRYTNAKEFNRGVNKGLKSICKALNIPEVSTYTFRHSWATIARNECGYSDEDVAFCLNHVSAHKITQRYIKINYSRIDEINERVIRFTEKKRYRIKRRELIKVKRCRK